MKITWSSEDLSLALKIKVNSEIKVTGLVQFLSTSVQKGDLFIALEGKRPGSDFIVDALNRGAACIITNLLSSEVVEVNKCILVTDCMKSLEALAAYRRNQLTNTKFIAITGSVGKTSTKEAMMKATSSCRSSFASRKNFNNYLGTLLNVASIPLKTDYAILELGMNHALELRELSLFLRPDLAIITNVYPVHTEFFSSLEKISEAKCEVIDGMPKDGIVILNQDSNFYKKQYQHIKSQKINKVYSFGESQKADCRLVDYKYINKSVIKVECGGKNFSFCSKIFGKSQAINLVIVILVCNIFKLDMSRVLHSLAEFSNLEGRGKIYTVKLKGKNITFIDDCYNSSPASLSAAINSMLDINKLQNSRRILVIGDMNELGENSLSYHLELLPIIFKYQIKKVIAVGYWMKFLYDKLVPELKLGYYPCVDDLLKDIALIEAGFRSNDIVLVKGSNGIHLNRFVSHFTRSQDAI